MKGGESWKQEIARKYIAEKILNQQKSLLQGDIQHSLDEIQQDILGNNNNKTNSTSKTDHFINLLFNKKGTQRNKIGYKVGKLLSKSYHNINQSGQEKLDLLYLNLHHAISQQELLVSLDLELNQLGQEISSSNSKLSENGTEVTKKAPRDIEISPLIETLNHKHPDSILVGPEIVAKTHKEFGGIGNSMMEGFQGYQKKVNFENMYGVAGKNTQTHPKGFKNENDVIMWKNQHPGVKSFLMYFGANTLNNTQTISDLKKRSLWLEKNGLQPILCTCIGSDNYPHLENLNEQILKLGAELEIPVLDFATKYIENPELFSLQSNKHPNREGYQEMGKMIIQASQ